MNRREFGVLLAVPAAAGLAVGAPAQEKDMQAFQAILERSLNEKKGIQVWINGQAIGLAVTKIGDGWIEGRNREYGLIVIRTERIDALAIA